MSNEVTDLEGPPPIVPGVARALSPLVRRIAAKVNDEAGPNTYLVGIDEIVVVDPGPANSEHLDAIAGCGGDRIRWIVTTGSNDASGANKLAKLTGALVLDVKGIGQGLKEYQPLALGESILGTEFKLSVLAAPGLVAPRVCFFLEEERVVFSGDYLDSDQQPQIQTAADFVDAVSQLRRKRLRGIAPLWGHLIETPKDYLEQFSA